MAFNLLLLGSCGYQWQPDFPDHLLPTICVPYVEGDEDGALTSEIIQAIGASGLADVRSLGGEYTLEVKVLGEESQKIGFRVDPQKVDGKIRKNLLPVEGRRSMTLEAVLTSASKPILGPFCISADAEFDYVDGDSIQDLTFVNPEGRTVLVLPFSLGQLEPFESASLAASKPLYRKLAQKIVYAISSQW